VLFRSPHAKDIMVKPAVAPIVESPSVRTLLNHLIGLAMAREISKHNRSKPEKLDAGCTTSPDLASPTSQPTGITNIKRRNATAEHATMPRQGFLNSVRGAADICCLTSSATRLTGCKDGNPDAPAGRWSAWPSSHQPAPKSRTKSASGVILSGGKSRYSATMSRNLNHTVSLGMLVERSPSADMTAT